MKMELSESNFLKLSNEGKVIVCELIAMGLLIIK